LENPFTIKPTLHLLTANVAMELLAGGQAAVRGIATVLLSERFQKSCRSGSEN
jgi:hypothetical protein